MTQDVEAPGGRITLICGKALFPQTGMRRQMKNYIGKEENEIVFFFFFFLFVMVSFGQFL